NTGNAEFYGAIGDKPVLVANALTSQDFTTEKAVSFTASSSGVRQAPPVFAVEGLGAQTVAALVSDIPGGRAGAELVIKPVLDAAGVELRQVFVSPQATAPEVASLMQAAGAGDAD